MPVEFLRNSKNRDSLIPSPPNNQRLHFLGSAVSDSSSHSLDKVVKAKPHDAKKKANSTVHTDTDSHRGTERQRLKGNAKLDPFFHQEDCNLRYAMAVPDLHDKGNEIGR